MNICIKNLFLLYFLPRKWIFFRTNIFVRLFQVRWHFHSIAWDLFPTSPQGHDNLNIVLKHSWFSLLPHVLNVSLVSPFLPSLYKSWLYYDLNWYSTSIFERKHFVSILILQVESQTTESSQNFTVVLKICTTAQKPNDTVCGPVPFKMLLLCSNLIPLKWSLLWLLHQFWLSVKKRA